MHPLAPNPYTVLGLVPSRTMVHGSRSEEYCLDLVSLTSLLKWSLQITADYNNSIPTYGYARFSANPHKGRWGPLHPLGSELQPPLLFCMSSERDHSLATTCNPITGPSLKITQTLLISVTHVHSSLSSAGPIPLLSQAAPSQAGTLCTSTHGIPPWNPFSSFFKTSDFRLGIGFWHL